jgi:hypothetical protein
LKACKRVDDVEALGAAAISREETIAHIGIGIELRRNLLRAAAHRVRAFQRCRDIGLDRAKSSLPAETKAERRIEDGERVERKLLAVDADIVLLLARAVGRDIVAILAAAGIVTGQPAIAEQLLAKLDLQRVDGRSRGNRRDRLPAVQCRHQRRLRRCGRDFHAAQQHRANGDQATPIAGAGASSSKSSQLSHIQ